MIALALWRFLKRTPLSTAMALLGVALGVTSIVSVHLISANVAERLDQLIPGELNGYTHFLHRDGLIAADYFELRQRWLQAAADEQWRDVEQLAPLIDETTTIQGQVVRVIGIDLFSTGQLSQLARAGDAQSGWDWRGVWADELAAELTQRPVNSVLEGDSGLLVADIGVAQEILGWDAQRLSYIGVVVRDSAAGLKRSAEQLVPGMSAGLPQRQLEIAAAEQYAVLSLAQQHPASQFGKSVLFNISALGLLAMLVAWFLIYQVAVSWLRRLWPVFSRLHVLGIEWRSLQLYFVGAMGLLGCVAALVGLAAGYFLAQLLFDLNVPHETATFAFSWWVAAKGVGSALAVCLIGGVWAFRRAQGLPQGEGRFGLLIGAALFAGVGVVWTSSGLLGGFAAIAICSFMAAFMVSPLLVYLRARASVWRGAYLLRWSAREAVWYPQDLAVAIAGLTLAIATAIGMGLMVDSFREDFSRMLERRISYDLVVTGDHQELNQLVRQTLVQQAVKRVQTYAERDVRLRGVRVKVVASHYDALESARYGFPRPLEAGEVLVSEQGAKLLKVNVGEPLTIDQTEFAVVGLFASFGDVQPRLLVPRSVGAPETEGSITSVSLKTAEPLKIANSLQQTFPDLKIERYAEIRQTALETFDQTFVITRVLILIALIVAGIGIYVALTTLRLNRSSSTRLMVALGLRRTEETGMDFMLGATVGLVAIVLAIPLGTLFGWILCSVINPRAFGWTIELQLAWQSYSEPLLWGGIAAVSAGLVRVGRTETGGLRAVV